MGYTRSAVAGFSWQTALKVTSALISLGKLGILTRLLDPVQFGIFSLVMISLGLMESFTQTGINVTILQSNKPITSFINAAWVIAIVRGAVISVLMIGLGGGMQQFFQEPSLWGMIIIAALVPLIKGFINPAMVTLQKNLHFWADTLYRVSLVLVDALVAVIAVWYFHSVIGLLIGLIAAALFEVTISFLFLKPRPRFSFKWSEAQPIFKNARSLNLSSLLNYLNENSDNLLIGRLVGTYSLGLYQPTYGLCHVPNYEVAKSANHGTLPIYTRLLDEPARLRKAFIKASISILVLGFLGSLPLMLFPNQIIHLIFGQQWSGAIELVPWLAAAGFLQGLTMVFYSLFYAQNHLKIANFHSLLTFLTLISGIWVFTAQFGLVGAGMGVFLSRIVGIPLLLWGARKTLFYA